ncbi:NAD-dependent malic enzyme [Candidatus Nitrosotalea sp. TS]|uniref:NAD-dependent malic enzyme n=1 Tax=Candidatus Nitrosotalea sp. TS TaxID=2341020 RepID=UPI00140D93BC|nr:NAD-dependent malic enzyme [Candidatus Nitrosotalea sp. TS]
MTGRDLLLEPALNKGTAFTVEERNQFDLHGLLPPLVETLEQQCTRAYEAYKRKSDDLERHIFLRALQDTNETLFYALLYRHIAEMAPIVYTPVVAQGCINFSHIYRRPRGLFLSYPLGDKIDEMIENRPYRDVDVIVVTDGERILGIGDQGAGGMGIPIGKLSLYTLIGGIDPRRTLPILLDVGTNNYERLHDPAYIGWRHERITGQAYWDFVDKFVSSIKRKLPNVLLQWEDFAKPHARPILDKYRDSLCTFNDDIQGTAAVTLGAMHGALNITKKKFSDQQVVILGAGSAGTGIAEYILTAMVDEGMDEIDARKHFFLLDSKGLLHTTRTDLSPVQQKFAQSFESISGWKTNDEQIGLAEVIENISATILIGVSSQPNQFTEQIIKNMASKVERPVIFPLSNPYDRAEAVPEDLILWTGGRALIATGTEFPPVSFNGKTIRIAQCNNFYIFPAIGLAVVASGARRITDKMMGAAARALGSFSPDRVDPDATLLPPIESMRDVAIHVAVKVGLQAQKDGIAQETSEQELYQRVQERFWTPEYRNYKFISKDVSN